MRRCRRAARDPRVQRPPPAGPPRSRFSPFVQLSGQAVPGSRRNERLELPNAALDTGHIRPLDPVDAEVLHREGSADRTVKDGLAESAVIERSRAREVAEQPTRERVAGASGIAHLVERVRRRPEDPVGGQKERAVLSSLDDDGAGTESLDLACRPEHVVGAAELPRFGLVDGDDIDAGHDGREGVAPTLDPVVPRVERDRLWSTDLIEHPTLDLGKEVSETDKLAVHEGRRT